MHQQLLLQHVVKYIFNLSVISFFEPGPAPAIITVFLSNLILECL